MGITNFRAENQDDDDDGLCRLGGLARRRRILTSRADRKSSLSWAVESMRITYERWWDDILTMRDRFKGRISVTAVRLERDFADLD
jgi:hypothetical protein